MAPRSLDIEADSNRICPDMPPLDIQVQAQNRVAFRTIGCRLNQCETAQMQKALVARGYRLVEWDEPADIRVVNTCTVTAKSDSTCRHEIRVARRLDPKCIVAVTGCYAQIDPEAIAAIPGVDLVLGNREKLNLTDWIAERRGRDLEAPASSPRVSSPGVSSPGVSSPGVSRRPIIAVTPHPKHPAFEGEFFSHFYGYTRAFLKVQTGCDSHCAYCIIPLARGPARSMPGAEVLKQVRLLVSHNYREVVLTGIDLGSWGRDTGEGPLTNLLALLIEEGGADRYRLSSIEPPEMDEALQERIEQAGDRVAHHFHLPLQSGADSVLQRMGRPYTCSEYHAVTTRLAQRFPDAALGADVIVGFPGETDQEFEETLSFVARTPITYLHVFAYSDRPGTRASAMSPKIHPETIHERSARLRELGARKKAAFQARLVGTEQRALVLAELSCDNRPVALTGNYQEVLITTSETLVNRFARVRLHRVETSGRWVAELTSLEDRAL